MSALVPRLFGDMSDWLDMDLPFRQGHPMRIEDTLTDTEYVLRVELPGVQPEKDIQVGVHDGLLSIRAERHEQAGGANQRSEFRYGMMHREVRLPASADVEHAKATYRDGILQVTVPLQAPTDTRAIPVTTS